MAVDPVCGMFVPETPASLQAEVRGTRYYFCNDSCRAEFTAPEREVRRLRALTVGAALLTAPVVVLEWVVDVPGAWRGLPLEALLMFVLATPVQFVAGWRFYRGTLHALRARVANMDVLVATGTSAAYAYSVVNTFAPGLFPMGMYYEVASLIVTLILFGRLLEHAVRRRASVAVRKLLDLAPRTARRILPDGSEEEVGVEALAVGDRFAVRPGGRIATDGLVEEGQAAVHEGVVTGESVPVERGPGDEVVGGTLAVDGRLVVRATRVGADTTLARIVRLVEDAQTAAAPIQRLADAVASWFVPVVVGVALLALGAWIALDAPFAKAFTSFIAVLIVACPCALGIATPAAIVAGTGIGAERGLLVKGGPVLERAKHLDTVVFDKTGTLTEGRPRVATVRAHGRTEEELLAVAAAVERMSEHPLAQALVRHADERGVPVRAAATFRSSPGRGARGEVAGAAVVVGNRAMLADAGVDLAAAEREAEALERAGQTTLFVAVDGRLAGLVGLTDTVKEGAAEAVGALRAMGFEVWLLTGDTEATGRAVASQVGIDHVLARVEPADKARHVRDLQRRGRHVAMVGDGVNDAPALAAADVGIALGSGTDVAVEAGGVVLLRDDVRDVVGAVQLARATLRKIRQNLFWAFAYNALLVPVAALGFFGENGPVLAGGAMALSSVTVVANALTLRRFRPRLDPARLRRVVRPSATPRDVPEPSAPRRGLPLRTVSPDGTPMTTVKEPRARSETAIDPVCRMTVPLDGPLQSRHGGRTWHFCSVSCQRMFDANPTRWSKG